MSAKKKYNNESSRKWRAKNPGKMKALCAAWYLKNRDKVLEKQRAYNAANKEKIRIRQKGYCEKNKKVIAARKKREYSERYHRDTNFRIAHVLRSRLRSSLVGRTKVGSFVSDLGCSIDELKVYLEGQFQPGMTWVNWTKHGWHIDHKRPLNTFDLTDRGQFLEACHYTNLRPLWANDNYRRPKDGRDLLCG